MTEPMQIDVIERFETFNGCRSNWDSVYAADPDANVFLSWDWQSRWLHEVDQGWLILAARSQANGDDYVAFFPLRLNARPFKTGGFYTEMLMAGARFADYTGVIARPEYVDAAIDAFGQRLNAMSWGVFRLASTRISEDSHARLVRHFPQDQCEILTDQPFLDSAGNDNSICPFVELPDTWDAYLSGLSANTRQKLRRLLRKVDADPDLQITLAGPDTIDRSIETLVDLWSRQWSERKGDNLGSIQEVIQTMLRHYCDLGILHMPILWRGGEPAGLLACLTDRRKHVMHFFIGARDERHNSLQPGLTLHAFNIRQAIGMGLTRYDFLRGNERYKYSFGAIDQKICNTVVRVRSGARKRNILDPRSIPQVLGLIDRQAAPGWQAKAEIGYRQLLMLDPLCEPARRGLAKLKGASARPPAPRAPLPGLPATGQASRPAHHGAWPMDRHASLMSGVRPDRPPVSLRASEGAGHQLRRWYDTHRER